MLNPTVAALIMTCNDEYWLPYVLESVIGMFERMVIYNIGSTDNTGKIIDWWVNKEKKSTDCFVRHLPMCEPSVQGALRNSMIAESRCDTYYIIDGDEINNQAHRIPTLANDLLNRNQSDPRKRYGVVKRIEVSPNLRYRYDQERTHHRLYTRDAIWTGNHPGEIAYFNQNSKSEVDYQSAITVLHLHNTERSPKEDEALRRMVRKSQKTYHPGTLIHFNILNKYPILRKPIENWPVSPALRKLQNVQ